MPTPSPPNLSNAARATPPRDARDVPQRFDLSPEPFRPQSLSRPRRPQLDSAAFVKLVDTAVQQSQDLLFLIGGHDGLPPEWKPRADLLLSLSSMTFPHELAARC